VELQPLFHEDMTSYDTEEAALALGLIQSAALVSAEYVRIKRTLLEQAQKYRHLPFLENTHGQGAKLRSFGGRCLTWIEELEAAHSSFVFALAECSWSRLCGAIGNYGGHLTPEVEATTLALLDLKPARAATQILSRVYHAKLAQALRLFAEALHKIAHDIRLGARSPIPIVHEPFGKKQKGSSAMPHKKNTIKTEQMQGFLRMARGRENALVSNIQTWEARSIEQSSVERVEWPDLFHIVLHMFEVVNNVLEKLVVYPDNMYLQIKRSCGTYATDEAKGFLAKRCAPLGIHAETAYRMIQLASFCVLKPKGTWSMIRETVPHNLQQADDLLRCALTAKSESFETFGDLLLRSGLETVPDLEATQEDVDRWNEVLREIFKDGAVVAEWQQQFRVTYLLRSEAAIFARFGL
jgi:adenylosuccinate lyase